jgi:DNA topoisomerase-3
MSETEVSALLLYGRTVLLKGFVSSKTGEVFDAILTFSNTATKPEFEFCKPDQHDGSCPKCKLGQLVRKEGAKGPFWYCSQWNTEPACDAAYRDDNGQPLIKAPIFCPKCKTGRLHLRKGESPFWSCSNYRNATAQCKATYPDRDGVPDFKSAPRQFSPGIKNVWNCLDAKKQA